jgi:hypothetical protein
MHIACRFAIQNTADIEGMGLLTSRCLGENGSERTRGARAESLSVFEQRPTVDVEENKAHTAGMCAPFGSPALAILTTHELPFSPQSSAVVAFVRVFWFKILRCFPLRRVSLNQSAAAILTW